MNTTYRFTSDVEPSDKELELLMKDVLSDVKQRAKKAELNFQKLQELQIREAIKRRKQVSNGPI